MNLKEIYENVNLPLTSNIPGDIRNKITIIGNNCLNQKGVYTVLVTLLYYKYLHPEQDVRLHQANMIGGFSGRSFDTSFVTPILRELGLPSMAESGWLTRSLEQPYPYYLNYEGKISGGCKIPFLEILDYLEKNPQSSLDLLKILLSVVTDVVKKSKIYITPLKSNECLTIDLIIDALDKHFRYNYKTHNGAKLPVLAFYAIYTSIINEMSRYNECQLAPLASLTACDKTSKASGDIEIFKHGKNFESIEIKLDRKINSQIVRIVVDKIYKFNPIRYYILSYNGIEQTDLSEIQEIVKKVKREHGCQIIINGVLPTIKYYLRLISNLSDFLEYYSNLIETDYELQPIHKSIWNDIIIRLNAAL